MACAFMHIQLHRVDFVFGDACFEVFYGVVGVDFCTTDKSTQHHKLVQITRGVIFMEYTRQKNQVSYISNNVFLV